MLITKAILGISYATRGRYAHAQPFARYVCDGSTTNVHSTADIVSFLRARCDRLSEVAHQKPMTDESALATLVVGDIERLIQTVRENLSDADLHEDSIHIAFDRMQAEYSAVGLHLGNASVRICDSFPVPYQDRTSWGMNYDISDHTKYGLDPGIVLKREHLMPLYTPTIIAHELTHTVLGQVETNFLARGFEEGVAEFFGTIFVGGKVLGQQIPETILINSRLQYPPDRPPWLAYSEAIRQVATLVLWGGWQSVVDLVLRGNREGRSVIKQAERDLLQREWPVSDLPTPKDRLARFAGEFLSFPQSLVVPPLSLLLAEYLSNGDSVDELILSHQIDPSLGRQALKALSDRVRLIVIFKDKISADETKVYLQSNTIRYEIE